MYIYVYIYVCVCDDILIMMVGYHNIMSQAIDFDAYDVGAHLGSTKKPPTACRQVAKYRALQSLRSKSWWIHRMRRGATLFILGRHSQESWGKIPS